MLLVMKEPDLGSALVYAPVVLAMLYVAGAPARPLATLVIGGAALVLLVLAAVALPERLGMAPEQQDTPAQFTAPLRPSMLIVS